MMGIGEFYLVQEDGNLPTMLAGGSAPGESGVSVLSLRFQGGLHFSAATRQHLIWFQSPVRIGCRMADRTLRHEAPAGSLAICPAGIDCAADAEESVDAIVVAVNPGQLTLAAAEDSVLEMQLIERLSGYDQALLDLARTLVLESMDDYRNGPLFWNDVASSFIDGLLARHTSESVSLVGQGRARAAQRLPGYPPRRIHRGRRARKTRRAQPVPLLSRVHPIRRHDPAPLCRASAIATGDRARSRRAI
jgi:hypothetical protein